MILAGLGYTMVISNTLVFIYYNVIVAWCIYYFCASLAPALPWQDCDNSWNTPACYVAMNSSAGNLINLHWQFTNGYTYNKSYISENHTHLNETSLNMTVGRKTPSEEYF